MEANETVKAYITRARNIASRSTSLGKIISMREIVYHVVRGIPIRLEKVGSVLWAQKGLTLEEVEQILTKKETRLTKRDGDTKHANYDRKDEKVYKITGTNKKKNNNGCFVCGRNNYIAKQCYYRQDRSKDNTEGRNQKSRPSSSGGKDGSHRHVANTAVKDKKEYSYCAYKHRSR